MCLNPNWIQSYDLKHKYFRDLGFCNFVRKNNEKFRLINGHFMTISGQFFANYIKIFHKTEVQTVILRCLLSLNLNLIKSHYIILVKIFVFSCLNMHHFRASLPKWVMTTPPTETSSHIFKINIFPKFFRALIRHIIRLDQLYMSPE